MLELNKFNIKSIPLQPGVYRVWARTESDMAIPLRRLCADDLQGLLYIGRTRDQTLRKRLYQFYASADLDMKTHNHSGGQKYFHRDVIRRKLGLHKLYFDFEITQFQKERENELLSEYSNIFGEYPPLNK